MEQFAPVESQDVQDMIYNMASALLDTYEIQPMKSVKYPFAFISSQIDIDAHVVKRQTWNNINTTVHFYDIAQNRAGLVAVMSHLSNEIRKQTRTENYGIQVRDISRRTSMETDGPQHLIHGILEVDILVT